MRTACDIVHRVAITWSGAYKTFLVFIRNRRMRQLRVVARAVGDALLGSESPPYLIMDLEKGVCSICAPGFLLLQFEKLIAMSGDPAL